jgi:hypothetical protein
MPFFPKRERDRFSSGQSFAQRNSEMLGAICDSPIICCALIGMPRCGVPGQRGQSGVTGAQSNNLVTQQMISV